MHKYGIIYVRVIIKISAYIEFSPDFVFLKVEAGYEVRSQNFKAVSILPLMARL